MLRAMEQSNKSLSEKKVYHSNLGLIAQLRPENHLAEQHMQDSQINSANKAVKMPWIPRKQHKASGQMQNDVLLTGNACDL